jgi:ubiquinone biosynthesis protein UbiJ
MPILDVVRAALSRPAGRVVEVPVRELVNQVVADHGFAGPADIARLREEITELRDRVAALEARLARQG